MKEISPWNVDDVDDHTRELALNAAQKAGLTLGAWIDRAIKNSTGLTLDELNPNASLLAPGNHGTADNLFDVDKQHLADVPNNMGLQVDPEERFGVTVEPVPSSSTRSWPTLPGLLSSGVQCIVLAAAIVVVGTGFLIYDIGFTGLEEQSQSATTTKGIAASANRTSAPLAPGSTYLGDTLAPSEPGVIEMLTAAAEQGDAIAQHDLATRYLHGNTVVQDFDLALKWLERAASQGHPASQNALDQLNAAQVAELYASAAAKGYSAAATRRKLPASAAEADSVATEKVTAFAKPAFAPAVRSVDAGKLLDKAGIAEAQQLLAQLGFKPGPADGILGRRTIRGIKLYQSSAGLPNDGKATSGLLRELRKLTRGAATKTTPTR